MESSRIEPLRYFDIGDNQVYMMREDLLPFSLGGNKVRIGWEFFCDMRRQEKNCMVVYGNSRSNLCRVLANLCYSRNIPCYMISSREEGEERRETNNSRLMRWFGAHVIPCEKSQIAQTVEETMEMLKGKGYRPYYIYGNKYGTGNEGVPVQAYVNAYDEICSYEAQNGIHFDYIFFPSGTGATQSGLISGHLLKQDQRHIMGILISSRENERARQVIWQGQNCHKDAFPLLLFKPAFQQDLRRDLRAGLLVGRSVLILPPSAAVMKQGRRIDELLFHFCPFLQIQYPGNARHIQKMSHIMPAEASVFFRRLIFSQALLITVMLQNPIHPFHSEISHPFRALLFTARQARHTLNMR